MAENALHQRARGADIALRRQTAIDLGAGMMTCHGRIRGQRISERPAITARAPRRDLDNPMRLAASHVDGQWVEMLRSVQTYYRERPGAGSSGPTERRGITMPYTVNEEAMTAGSNIAYNGYAHSFAEWRFSACCSQWRTWASRCWVPSFVFPVWLQQATMVVPVRCGLAVHQMGRGLSPKPVLRITRPSGPPSGPAP